MWSCFTWLYMHIVQIHVRITLGLVFTRAKLLIFTINTNALFNVLPGRVGAAQMQRRKLSGGPFLPVVLVLVLLRCTAPTHAHGGGGDRRTSFARCVFILCVSLLVPLTVHRASRLIVFNLFFRPFFSAHLNFRNPAIETFLCSVCHSTSSHYYCRDGECQGALNNCLYGYYTCWVYSWCHL